MKVDSLETLVKKHNPFFAKEENEIQYFKDYGEAYLYALRHLHKLFPRGYIDMPLYLHVTTGQTLLVCEREVMKMKMLKTFNNGVVLCEPIDGELPKMKYETIMRSLHSLSQTTFSQDYFNWAWDKFLQELDTV